MKNDKKVQPFGIQLLQQVQPSANQVRTGVKAGKIVSMDIIVTAHHDLHGGT
jgi:hypothetical protein